MKADFWDEAISKLAGELIERLDRFSSEQNCSCPVCQNQLKIRVGRYQRSKTKMIGITIECDICDKAIATDFIEG